MMEGALQLIPQLLQWGGAAVAVYVAIRVDIARLTVRVDHLERDVYPAGGRK